MATTFFNHVYSFITPDTKETVFLNSFDFIQLPIENTTPTERNTFVAQGKHPWSDKLISLTYNDCMAIKKAKDDFFNPKAVVFNKQEPVISSKDCGFDFLVKSKFF